MKGKIRRILFLGILGSISAWANDWSFIRATDLFSPGSRNCVRMTPTGEIYLLNAEEKQVQHYGTNGELVNIIGGEGKGPGYFEHPLKLQLHGDILYVHELDFVSAFSTRGSFLAKHRLPNNVYGTYFKAIRGWVYQSSYVLLGSEDDAVQLKAYSDDFQKERTILTFQASPDEAFLQLQAQAEKVGIHKSRRPIPINPAPNYPNIYISGDGKYVYTSEQGRLAIHVIDMETREIVHSYQPSYKRIPLDQKWAEMAYQKFVGALRDNTNQTPECYRNFPKYFPPIKYMVTGYEDILMVVRYTAVGGKYEDLFFDRAFQPVEVGLSEDAFLRTIGFIGDFGYVMTYDDEEFGIAKVPRDLINSFVLEHPRDPEWTQGL